MKHFYYEGEEDDFVLIRNEKTEKAAELIKNIYESEGGGVGGYAYIVTDDYNIEDRWIESSLESARKRDMDTPSEQCALACILALEFLKEMTEDERQSAIDIYHEKINNNV